MAPTGSAMTFPSLLLKHPATAVLAMLMAGTVICPVGCGSAPAQQKPRVLALTDITNEPDDEQSMVRFLLYSNEYNVEGLLATTSIHLPDRVRPEKIRERVETCGEVRGNLIKHADGFPTTGRLLSLIKSGRPARGMEGAGAGKSTEASSHLIEVVDRPGPHPVWVTVCGSVTEQAARL